MMALRLTAAGISVLIALASAGAPAQPAPGTGVLAPPIRQPGGGSLYPGNGSLFPTPVPSQGETGSVHRGHRRFDNGVFIYEQPYAVHDVVVVHDEAEAAGEPPPSPPASAPASREPYVVGHTYGSLPGGCLKMIEGGASYFHCSEGWYRQVGAQFRAVAGP
jgi:hypothetical protein